MVCYRLCSVTKSCPALRPHRLQHASLLWPPVPSGVCSDSMSIESVMLSNCLIFCHPLLFLLSVFPSMRVFSNESTLHMAKYALLGLIPSTSLQMLFHKKEEIMKQISVIGLLWYAVYIQRRICQ